MVGAAPRPAHTVNVGAEVDRFLDSLRPTARPGTASTRSRGPAPATSADTIYRRALELLAAEGPQRVTARRLASDLGISTRTLYKRIISRDNMFDHIAALHCARLELRLTVDCCWRHAMRAWCLALHRWLIENPQLTTLLPGHIRAAIVARSGEPTTYAVSEGISVRTATTICTALIDVTINDAVQRSRVLTDADRTRHSGPHEQGLSNIASTLDLLLAGSGAAGCSTERRRDDEPRDRRDRAEREESAMNRTEEWRLAWALADVASAFLDKNAHDAVCTMIGAGDQERAVKSLLAGLAQTRTGLPGELATRVDAWVAGYVGSDSENPLKVLIEQIPVGLAVANT